MLAIRIKKQDGNLCAYADNAYLFQFRYLPESKSWKFWVTGVIPKEKEGRAFPWIFFQDLCRSVYFLKYDEPLFTSNAVTIVSGKSYIK